MEQYINKSALVAEIKRRMDENSGKQTLPQYFGMVEEDLNILSLIDTLEVKEVDLEKEIQKAFIYHESHGDDFRSDCQIETAFRTGFEDGFKCKGYISKIQVNNLKEEIKRYFNEQPIMTRSKGVDYKLIPSAEKIAKHFFELGMQVSNKAQKGEKV